MFRVVVFSARPPHIRLDLDGRTGPAKVASEVGELLNSNEESELRRIGGEIEKLIPTPPRGSSQTDDEKL